MPEAGMMHIGELAERTALSQRTIRHYDEIGLLTPSGRSEGGFRLYTEGDLGRLLLIRRMKPLGYSLDQMGDLLRALDGADGVGAAAESARRALNDFRTDAEERRAKLAKQLDAADEFIGLLTAHSSDGVETDTRCAICASEATSKRSWLQWTATDSPPPHRWTGSSPTYSSPAPPCRSSPWCPSCVSTFPTAPAPTLLSSKPPRTDST